MRGTDTISREETLTKLILLPSEKGSTLKGKNLLPFQKGLSAHVSKREVPKVVSLVKIVGNLPRISSPFQ